MHKILNLAKILRKGGNESIGGGNSQKSMQIFWLILGILISAFFIFMGINLTNWQKMLGDPIMLIQLLFAIGAIIGLVFSIPGILNNLYMSSDLQVLLTFPYRPMQIIIAKMINVSGIVVGTAFVFTIPAGISYGIAGGMGAGYFLAVILAFICIPLFVVSAIGILLVVIMYFVHGLRNKDLLKIIGTVIAFLLIVGAVIAVNEIKTDENAVSGMVGTLAQYAEVLPLNIVFRNLMEGLALVPVLEVIGMTAGAVVLFFILASFLYVPGALSMQETGSGGKLLTDSGMAKACRQRSQFRAYLSEELRHVKREPAYLMQGFLYTILYPAVFIVIYVISANGVSFMSLSSINSPASALGWATCMSALITFVASSTNAIACSPMSREGEDIMILKQTPVSYKTVLRSKQFAAILVCALGSTTYVVIGGIVLVIMGYLPVWTVPYAMVINIALLFFSVGISMMHDIKKPSFTWESEAMMLKKVTGAGSVIMMIAGIMVPMLFNVLMPVVGGFYWVVMIVLIIICVLMGYLETRHLYREGEARMLKY